MKTDIQIRIENVCVNYGKKTVLNHLNLDIHQGDFLGIIGPNGSGKTTLLKLILGLVKPSTGNIKYFQESKEVPHLEMGYLPQNSSIDAAFPISVYDIIASGLKGIHPFGHLSHEEKTRIENIIAYTGLEQHQHLTIGELSGGLMQRALLGRAIISNPTLLILDEPNTYIDKAFEKRLYEILHDINRHCSIVLVSHDITGIQQHASRVIQIERV